MSDYGQFPGPVTRTGDVSLSGARLRRLEDQSYNIRGNVEVAHDLDGMTIQTPVLGVGNGWGVGIQARLGGALYVGLGRTAERPGLCYLGLYGKAFAEPQVVAFTAPAVLPHSMLVYAKASYGASAEPSSAAIAVTCHAVEAEQATAIQADGSISIPLAWATRTATGWGKIEQLLVGQIVIPLRLG